MELNKEDKFPLRKKRSLLFYLIYYPVFMVIAGLLLDFAFFHQITNYWKSIFHYAIMGIAVSVIMQRFYYERKVRDAKSIFLLLMYIIVAALIMVVIERTVFGK